MKSALLDFDMPVLIERLKLNQGWDHGELESMILFKRPERQIVLTALHPGTEINSFQSNDSITFQIIEGKLMFHTQSRTVMLEKGNLLTLHEKINYKLTSSEETVFLLTIAKSAFSKMAEKNIRGGI